MEKINGSLRAIVTMKQNVKKPVKTIRTAITLLYQWKANVTCPGFVESNQGQAGQDIKEVEISMRIETLPFDFS